VGRKETLTKKSTRDAYGNALIELASKNNKIVVLDSDLSRSTRTVWFQQKFPHRFFNMGIAEANMMGVAAGLSMTGKIPFVTTYSIFIGRAFEQIRQTIAYSKSNVKIVATHAGLSTSHDGGSHQGIEDITLMRVLPSMTILSPADYYETKHVIFAAAEIQGPVYIRISKYETEIVTEETRCFEIGKGYTLTEGNDLAIFVTGVLAFNALEASKILKDMGIAVSVINMPTIKPLDYSLINEVASKCNCIMTVEEHSCYGGLFGAIAEYVGQKFMIPVIPVAINDHFGETGEWSELLEKYGLAIENIVDTAMKMVMTLTEN
jgi:transketolase